MADRNLLRLSATLLFVGVLFSLLVGLLHPSSGNPNNHTAEFAVYAASSDWTAVHLGQFVGLAVIIAGLFVSGATSLAGAAKAWLQNAIDIPIPA